MDDLDVLRKLKVSPQDFRLTLQDLMRLAGFPQVPLLREEVQ